MDMQVKVLPHDANATGEYIAARAANPLITTATAQTRVFSFAFISFALILVENHFTRRPAPLVCRDARDAGSPPLPSATYRRSALSGESRSVNHLMFLLYISKRALGLTLT